MTYAATSVSIREPQGELLYTPLGQCAGVIAKVALVDNALQRCVGVCVETHRVRHVEYFPGELESPVLFYLPCLVQS